MSCSGASETACQIEFTTAQSRSVKARMWCEEKGRHRCSVCFVVPCMFDEKRCQSTNSIWCPLISSLFTIQYSTVSLVEKSYRSISWISALCFIIQLQILSIIPSSRCVCSAQSSEEGRLNLLKTLIIGLSPWIPITHPPSMSKSEHASIRAVRLTLLFSIHHMLNIQNQCRISSQSYNISITT